MFKEDNKAQELLTNQNFIIPALAKRKYVDQVNDFMEADFASLGLSPRIKPEDYGATAENDSESLTEPLMVNVEGGLGLQSAC